MWPAKYGIEGEDEQALFSDGEIQDIVNVMQSDGAINTEEQAATWRKLVQSIRYALDIDAEVDDTDDTDDDDDIPF